MTNNYEAHKLAINNLEIIEQAVPIINEAQEKIFKKIDEKIESFVTSNGWDGVFNYLEDQISFQPKNWLRDKKNEEYLNYFAFDSNNNDEGEYYLSHLTGAVDARFGFCFIVDVKIATRKTRYNGNIWQKFLHANNIALQLQEHGFEVVEDSIFLPVSIDSSILAECYPNAIDDALTTIDEAMEKIKANLPLFEQIIKDAETYDFG